MADTDEPIIARTSSGLNILDIQSRATTIDAGSGYRYCGIIRTPNGRGQDYVSLSAEFRGPLGSNYLTAQDLAQSQHPEATLAKKDLTRTIATVRKDPESVYRLPSHYETRQAAAPCWPGANNLTGKHGPD